MLMAALLSQSPTLDPTLARGEDDCCMLVINSSSTSGVGIRHHISILRRKDMLARIKAWPKCCMNVENIFQA